VRRDGWAFAPAPQLGPPRGVWTGVRTLAHLLAALLLGALLPAAAAAAPPPNDLPQTAALFSPYAAENGTPAELEGVIGLAEASPDPGVPSCLGRGSFLRTAWYRVPAVGVPRELTVDAIVRTATVVDLAVFVQPGPEGPPLTLRPNACAGEGAGGADAADDRVASVSVRVPAYRAVLVQVGLRRVPAAPQDEAVVLALSETLLGIDPAPAGDRAGLATPQLGRDGEDVVDLAGATTTEEDPVTAACPSLAGVWRRFVPRRGGRWTISARGRDVTSLAVFAGSRPSPEGSVDCVDREGSGTLALPVRARARRPLWIRVGTDRPARGARARVRAVPAQPGETATGGACLAEPRPRLRAALVGVPVVPARNRARELTLRLRVLRGPLCEAQLRVVGPRGRLYARTSVPVLARGVRVVRVPRVRRLVRGHYRLRISATGVARRPVSLPTALTFRLRQP
jgi:hypothetical protein